MVVASGSKSATFYSYSDSPDSQFCGRPSFLLEASEEEWIRKAGELVTPLLAQAALVQSFKGKWMMISMRLQRLSDALNSVRASTSLQQIFLNHRTSLSQIVGSLLDGEELVQKSIDVSYCGKLLMQSNLDALVTKLDHHLRDLDEVKSCISQHKRTIAITAAMTRDDGSEQYSNKRLKVEQLWDMFAKLRSGNADSKILILESLIDYMRRDEKAALLIKNEGDVSRLIHLLDSSVPAIKERAAHTISMMAMLDECKKGLIAEGVIQPLLRVLDSGNINAKEKAARTLFELTSTAENAHAVASHGSSVSLLAKLCKQGTPAAMVCAGGTLCNMSRNQLMHRALVENGGVDALVFLLTCTAAEARQYAAKALRNLASGNDEKFRNVIAKQGGIQYLVAFLKHELSADDQEIAIQALSKFATSAVNVKALASAGYVAQLTELIDTGCPRVRHLAALAIGKLSAYMDLKGQIDQVPPIPFLESVDSSKYKIALSNTVLVKDKHLDTYERQVPALSNVLDPCKHSLSKYVSLSAFLTLSSNSVQRRRITCAERQPQLEKLADRKITGANKFLLKIGGKKLFHLLTRKASKSKRDR